MDREQRRDLRLVPTVLAAYRARVALRTRAKREKQKENEMRPRPLWVLILGTLTVGATVYLGKVQATPSAGFTATTLAVGRFGDINASSHVFFPDASEGRHKRDLWLSFQKTKGPSDLYVQSNVWTPGGTTGWHTHPSHSLIIVTAGTLTAYDGDDPACTPHVYTAGMGLVDEGGDHTHVIRNESSLEARTVAVQLIPAAATRRIDAAGNAACPF
jgi:hypothetical protein